MADMKDLKAKLETNPAARAKFLADLLGMLENNGVDVNDANVLKSLDLNMDLSDGPKFVAGLKASSIAITITA